MDELTKAAKDRVEKALKDRLSGGYTEVMAEDVQRVCAAVAEDKRTQIIADLAYGVRPDQWEKKAEHSVFQKTDHLRHLLEMLG